jgi:predicted flap endonuclease-1-like 5' DNA nuclease
VEWVLLVAGLLIGFLYGQRIGRRSMAAALESSERSWAQKFTRADETFLKRIRQLETEITAGRGDAALIDAVSEEPGAATPNADEADHTDIAIADPPSDVGRSEVAGRFDQTGSSDPLTAEPAPDAADTLSDHQIAQLLTPSDHARDAGTAESLEPGNERPSTAGDVGEEPAYDPNGNDNLTQIRGIGPRIASVLSSAGITTYLEVARHQPGDLMEILEESGTKLGPVDTSTWPLQAGLAAHGRWLALRAFHAAGATTVSWNPDEPGA